jgi:hypothetical protein
LKYKPNTKLTNFQSFGIPVISVSYESFVEFGLTLFSVLEFDPGLLSASSFVLSPPLSEVLLISA